jgi:DNA-binding SARP family transcriptional activator
MRNEPRAAVEHAKSALDCFDDSGCVHHQANYRFSMVWARILVGDFAGARHWIAEERLFSDHVRSLWQETVLRATEAHIALESGDSADAEVRISGAFRLSRESGYDHSLGHQTRPWISRLCEVALKAGIETEYVRKLIKRYNWPTPQSRPEQWPWPIKIRALGSFQILRDDEPLTFLRKAPRKPLALLKALIAFGISRVPEQKLIDTLWPQEEGDLAYESFKVAIKRLRKLLRSTKAVIVAEGTVSLDPREVWVDAEAFEVSLSRVIALEQAVQVLELYRGDFLPEEADMPWSVSTRERLRRKFLKAVETLGYDLEQQQLWEQASRHYARALDADPIAEVFYQGLMRCQFRMGQITEGVSTFRRLRQMLSVSLGVTPSPESEMLHRALLAA